MKKGLPHKQKGAAAIEFALVFVIFFAVLYGLISYSLPLLIMQSFNHATAEGVRRSMAVDPMAAKYGDKLKEVSEAAVREQLAWMPDSLREHAIPLGKYEAGVMTVSATLNSQYLYAIMPQFKLGVFSIPDLPDELKAESSIQLEN